MFLRTSNRKAISVVLTTMIILVASVVLGTGVVIYGTSLFQTGASEEKISTQGVKVWVNATNQTGIAWGAAGIRNTGDKLISVDHIQVRGAEVPFAQWYVDKDQTRVTSDNLQSQYNHTKGTQMGGDNHGFRDSVDSGVSVSTSCPVAYGDDHVVIELDFDGLGAKPTLCLLKAIGPTSLNPGEGLIVYFRLNNALLTPVDSGATTSVSIFAGKTGAPTSVTIANP